jgi:Family of unknown function (DUF6868)
VYHNYRSMNFPNSHYRDILSGQHVVGKHNCVDGTEACPGTDHIRYKSTSGVRTTLREILIWSLVINYGILLVWFAVFWQAHDWLYRLHTRWFRLSRETFDAIHYGGMAAHKIGILLLNLAPLVGLFLVT